jgi:hypothetical protein
VIGAGLALGLAAALIKNYLPQKIDSSLGLLADSQGMTGSISISMILAIAAVLAWPLSKVVSRVGTERCLTYGLDGTFIFFAVSAFVSNAFYQHHSLVLLQ